MTTEEFNKLKQEIIAKFNGVQPEYDYDQTPLNEVAKEIKQLRIKQRAETMALKKQQALISGQKQAPAGLDMIAKSLELRKAKEWATTPLPSLFIEDKDLKGFTELEKTLLRSHFSDMELTNKALATSFGFTTQQVTALLKSGAVQLLTAKLMGYSLKLETWKSLLRALRNVDSKTLLRLAEQFGIIKPESLEISVNKPIEDQTARQALKELGDRLANHSEK